MDMDARAQLIAVVTHEELTYDELVTAAAVASCRNLVSCRQQPEVDLWLKGAFRKTVRRVKPAKFPALAAEFDTVVEMDGRVVSAAVVPKPYREFSKKLAKLQVSGLTAPAGPAHWFDSPDLVVVLSSDLGMSVGKAAAQASHAVMAYMLRFDVQHVPQFSVQHAPAATLEECALYDKAVQIKDAGITEVPPDSLTAVAYPVR